MAGKSLPPVSAKVIADAEQFIAEFRRAERAAQGSTSRVGAEVDKMAKTLTKKFSLGDIGKDLLKGLGLGSGFALAQQAGELLSGHFERAAQAAQDMEAATARQLENTRELIRLHQTDEQAAAALEKQYEAEAKRMEELQKPRTVTTTMRRKVFGDYEEVTNTTVRDRTKAENDELNAQIELVQKLAVARAQLANKDKASESAAAAKTLAATIATANEEGDMLSRRMAGMEESSRLRNQEAEQLERLAAKYRALGDPTLKFRQEMDEIDKVMVKGLLTIPETTAALAALNKQMIEDADSRKGKWFDSFFGNEAANQTQKLSGAAHELGWAFSSAFEDAILQGEKFSDVLDALAQDIIRIAIRTAITQPIGQALGGALAGAFGSVIPGFGGGKAVGGPVDAGMTYLVGEKGPELFRPNSGGTIVPNHRLADSGGSTGGGTYYIDARGADRTGLARLEAMIRSLNGSIEMRAVAAVGDSRRRSAFA